MAARVTTLLLIALFVSNTPAGAYSVQTHEQLIDLTWKSSIRPFLLSRYPGMSEAQLTEAHAYAYGGAAIQDLGYYPFGNDFFSDLTHYVRSGDFVRALIDDAKTPDELAFAVGALSHYIADTVGHSEAVNPAVGVEFPALKAKYGPVVTYAEGEHQHVRTEFAFDINELAKRRFAPSAYLKHVGLHISEPLLARAFYDTYGLDLYNVLGKRGRAVVRGYRFSVRSFLPRIAYAEVLLHRGSLPKDQPGPAIERLTRELKQSEFENGWEKYRKKAGIGTHLLAGIIFVMPKVGTLSDLAIKGPSADTEELYVESVLHTTDILRQTLQALGNADGLLPNRDLDTGAKVKPGGYPLTDRTYARLLARVAEAKSVPLALKQDILEYYADLNAPFATKKNLRQWDAVLSELQALRAVPVAQIPMRDNEHNRAQD